jgi:hypothetical protein
LLWCGAEQREWFAPHHHEGSPIVQKLAFRAIFTSVLLVGTFVFSGCGAAPENGEDGATPGTTEQAIAAPAGTIYLFTPKVGIHILSSSPPQTVGQCCTNPQTGVSCAAEPCSQCAGVC